jgi:NADH-quinone oxidoreductase subunit L
MLISIILAVGGIWIARNIYLKKPAIAESVSSRFKGLYNLLWNKYFVDEVYDAAVVNPIVKGSESFLWKFTDNKIIDGTVNGTASIIGFISARIRKIQTGVAQIYAIVMMFGIVIALFWIILSL